MVDETKARQRRLELIRWPALCVAYISANLSAERDRWALWLPVFLGAGLAIYFSLPDEPSLWLSGAVFTVATFVFAAAYRFGWPRAATLLAVPMALSAGMTLGGWATQHAAAPVLERSQVFADLTGRVTEVESFSNGPRVRLESLIDRYGRRDKLPFAVRVKLRSDSELPIIGTRIQVTARLSPPPRPSFPGAYDFARRAWFERLGGVGFAYSHWLAVPDDGEIGFIDRLRVHLGRFRSDVSMSIRAALTGISGDVATALLTGDRAGVPETVLEDLRRSGLAHLLAISGLHIGMVAAIVFVVVRFALALRESWARDRPIKKWAAAAALTVTFGYLLLSGATIPTQRAFLMTGTVLLAVLMDRQAISMRLVAVAAAIVLIIAPEGIVGASFQLSFAAVVALVAIFENYRFGGGQSRERGFGGRIGLYLAVICLTTIVAGAATAPFAIYHFGRIAHYSVLANVAAVPIVTFLVMPMGLLALLIMPFGLEAYPLMLAGLGIDAVLWIADAVADLPGAVAQIPALPGWGLCSIVAGGLWCALWRLRWRLFGLPAVAIGLISPFLQATPVAIFHEDGDQAALAWNGKLWVEAARRDSFAQSVWSERVAMPVAGTWKDLEIQENPPIRCGPLGCMVRLRFDQGGELALAFSADPRTVRDDCAMSDVARLPVRPHPALCRDGVIAIDPAKLHRDGAVAIYREADGVRVVTVESKRGRRPWTGQPID